MDSGVEQSIQVTAEESYEEHGVDDIDADEEINEVLEDETELDKSGSIADVEEEACKTEEGSTAETTIVKPIVSTEEKKSSKSNTPTGSEKGITNCGVNGEKKSNENEENKDCATKKLLRMQLSTQVLQKLLKEGKMEKLPTGSFRISAEALKELKNSTSYEGSKHHDSTNQYENPSSGKRKYSSTEDFSDDEDDIDDDEEDIKDYDVDDYDYEPKKSASKKAVPAKTKPAVKSSLQKFGNQKSSKMSMQQLKKKETNKQSIKSDLVNSQMSESKPKVKTNFKIHDYVSDKNSSEDEDNDLIKELKDSMAELAPRKPGHLSKPISLLFEALHKHMFGNLSEDSDDTLEEDENQDEEERIKQLAISDPDFGADDSPSTINDIPNDFWMVGNIGSDGKTKMCIRSTGKNKMWEGRKYPLYNIDTGVGSTTTSTQLMVTALRASHEQLDKGGASSVNLPDPDLVEQINQKTISLRKYKEQCKVLRRRYFELARHVATRPQLQTVGDLVAAASRFLTQDQLLLLTMQLKGGCDATQGARFSTREKLLALGLYQQHPDTYKWLHRILHLPSTAVLERWLDTVARGNPTRVKQLMYHVYTRYCFRPRDDILPHPFGGY